MKNHKLILTSVLLTLQQSAFGQGAPDTVRTTLNAIDTSLASLQAGAFTTFGLYLIGMFITLNVVYSMITTMALGRGLDDLVPELVPMALSGFLAMAFMGQFGSIPDLAAILRSVMDVIAKGLLGQDALSSKTGDVLAQLIGSLFNVIDKLMGTYTLSEAMKSVSGFTLEALGNTIAVLIGFFYKWIAILIVSIILAIVFAMVAGAIAISQFTVAIALAFLPIFVPMLLNQWSRGFFDTWLRFAIVSFFTKIVGLVVIKVSVGAFDVISDIGNRLAVKPTTTATDLLIMPMGLFVAAILLSLVIMSLASSISSIAGGLIGSSAVGMQGLGQMSRGFGSQWAGKGLGKAGKFSAGAAKGAVAGATGADAFVSGAIDGYKMQKDSNLSAGGKVSLLGGKSNFEGRRNAYAAGATAVQKGAQALKGIRSGGKRPEATYQKV